jgi:hypothetical protein
MQSRAAGIAALLTTGLLAGAFLYGRVNVVPTFTGVPLAVHLAFRVELMRMNAVVMPLLMAAAIVTAGWFAATLRRKARLAASCAVLLALASFLITGFGNVPINEEMKKWAEGALAPDYLDRLHTWGLLNDARVAAAFGAFVLVIAATDLSRSRVPETSTHLTAVPESGRPGATAG